MWIRSQYNELINLDTIGYISQEGSCIVLRYKRTNIVVGQFTDGKKAIKVLNLIHKAIVGEHHNYLDVGRNRYYEDVFIMPQDNEVES